MDTRRIAGEALAWCEALALPVIVTAAVPRPVRGTPVAVGVLVSVVASALVFGLLRRRPLPALVLLLFSWFLAASTARSWGMLAGSLVTVAPAVGYVAATRSRWISGPGAVLALGALVAESTVAVTGRDFVPAATLAILSVLTAWLAGASVRDRREHATALQTQAAAQAVTAERLRIARELHDMVAHSIGIIAIQAGVGARVIQTQPAEARSALDAIEATSRQTLAGLRHMLTALRQPEDAPLAPTPGLADIERLAEATGRAGVRVDVQWRGQRRPLPPELDVAAYRIVQEALTNVVRHAGTDRARVIVETTGDELAIEIVDEGRGGTGEVGFGLVGMRERVDLLHGRLTAGPGPDGGFRVSVRLPIPVGVR